MKRLFFTIAFCLWPIKGLGEPLIVFDSGNDLYRHLQDCKKFEGGKVTYGNYWSCGYRSGFIVGVHDTFIDLQATLKSLGASEFFLACPPKVVAKQQILDVVFAYLTNNPAKRQNAANILIEEAIVDAWPCPE